MFVCLASFFFVIGHSLAPHFYQLEKKTLTPLQIIIPLPKKGKIVPAISIFISILIAALELIPKTAQDLPMETKIGMFGLFFAFPWVLYITYIVSGMKKKDGHFYFEESKEALKFLFIIVCILVAASRFL